MTIEEQKEKIYDEGIIKINSIYEIFKDYYGEERVDLQNIKPKEVIVRNSSLADNDLNANTSYYPFIIVHFPEVNITNEHDDSVLIKDLWAKITVTFKGAVIYGFYLNRSTYQSSHWLSDYMHSHISGIPKSNITTFLSPCLGSGPIRDTIASLARGYDEALWQLFCRELDVYTRTESLNGGPYRRMTNITNTVSTLFTSSLSSWHSYARYNYPFNADLVKEFILHVINSKLLKFNYHNGVFNIAMDYYQYYLTISNLFIEWGNMMYNKSEHNKTIFSLANLIDKKILIPVSISNRKILMIRNSEYSPERLNGTKVLTFKGKDILLNIEIQNNETVRYSHILNADMATNILRTLLVVINYKYGRQETNSDSTSNSKTRILL